MGVIPQVDTHGKRSSSMSFALRWKHENVRLITLSIIISIAMTFMLLVLLYGTAERSVSVVVNGQESVVKTKQWVLQRLLDEQAITVGPHDKVSIPLNAAIKDGDRVVIDTANPVTVTADGKTWTVYTTEDTVQAAIEELNIPVRSYDKVYPALTAELTPNMAVKVVRVEHKVTSSQHTVPFTIVKQDDPTLEQGKEKTIKNGTNGVVVKQFESVYEDGKLVSTALVEKTVEKPTVNQVVAVGTKKIEPKVTALSAKASSGPQTVSLKGISFKAKKVLKNVTLTAYSAGVKSTGKSASHPQYGITASGAKVKEGRTIAVDPNVIPIGWWVYIEGIGFRRAEDKGSAVKGNKIDVYYDSEDYAEDFGTKKGYTVYVIGPNKPSSS
ncbi:uncharacterized protein YabE (DUF348 family) [Paenibacillus cellulosilyticus]|uniref:Uncharacterized protein YabE (DUF348 family) n=1 Tax=Paenibacillus cellulosilyticus TaxID=375489 RepID=A0A2V2YRG6_9BACL|nr:3D domain-containing protein [Paenibacillus cellulosilyticus]PWV95939.1 uncharacterized protein YabE (DUF348 family) [Paenibacillus cellulosilyticus]QKS48412.1 DUF348 domain-containing protein [Paenibacillus cellulosilyticus]